jgi:hypothetical protein
MRLVERVPKASNRRESQALAVEGSVDSRDLRRSKAHPFVAVETPNDRVLYLSCVYHGLSDCISFLHSRFLTASQNALDFPFVHTEPRSFDGPESILYCN